MVTSLRVYASVMLIAQFVIVAIGINFVQYIAAVCLRSFRHRAPPSLSVRICQRVHLDFGDLRRSC
jgi:hypothetical protein